MPYNQSSGTKNFLNREDFFSLVTPNLTPNEWRILWLLCRLRGVNIYLRLLCLSKWTVEPMTFVSLTTRAQNTYRSENLLVDSSAWSQQSYQWMDSMTPSCLEWRPSTICITLLCASNWGILALFRFSSYYALWRPWCLSFIAWSCQRSSSKLRSV